VLDVGIDIKGNGDKREPRPNRQNYDGLFFKWPTSLWFTDVQLSFVGHRLILNDSFLYCTLTKLI